MADENERCPRCDSVDTISYWDQKREREALAGNGTNASMALLYKSLYPSARVCVDCQHVWWHAHWAQAPVMRPKATD